MTLKGQLQFLRYPFVVLTFLSLLRVSTETQPTNFQVVRFFPVANIYFMALQTYKQLPPLFLMRRVSVLFLVHPRWASLSPLFPSFLLVPCPLTLVKQPKLELERQPGLPHVGKLHQFSQLLKDVPSIKFQPNKCFGSTQPLPSGVGMSIWVSSLQWGHLNSFFPTTPCATSKLEIFPK